jgi:uncharacterized protein (DUF488 family)
MTESRGVQPAPAVWTIGHSNHSAERLLELLRERGITAVADVRTSPYSAYSSQFNREQLQRLLDVAGIGYVFLGIELGGRPADPALYDAEDHVRYDLVAASDTFAAGLERLLHGISTYRVAILCGEEDPISCHRRRLVGRVLVERGISLEHIRGDGSITPEAEMAGREVAEFPERFQMTLDGPAPWRSEHAVKRRSSAGGEGWSAS